MKIPESKTDPKYKELTDHILAGLKMMVADGHRTSSSCRSNYESNS